MITGTSEKGSILSRGLNNQEAVHFGGVALKNTNALPILRLSTDHIINVDGEDYIMHFVNIDT